MAKFGLLNATALDNKTTGYFAAVYQDSVNKRAVYVNRGTDDGQDAVVDVLQGLGKDNGQYFQAYQNAITMQIADPHVVFVGHSLGGGLATLQSLATQRPAWTYNAASLSEGTMAKYDLSDVHAARLIQSYYVCGEAISLIQDQPSMSVSGSPLLEKLTTLPTAQGQRIALTPPRSYVSADWSVKMHYMSSVIGSLFEQLAEFH